MHQFYLAYKIETTFVDVKTSNYVISFIKTDSVGPNNTSRSSLLRYLLRILKSNWKNTIQFSSNLLL